MLKAAVTLAFFGMLRCGEYTSPTKTFWDPQVNLGYRDVKFQAGGKKLTVHIKASKTDPFREGHKIRLVMLDNEFCPVTALKHYYKSLHHTAGPLFQHEDGTYLTSGELSSIIKQYFTEEVNLNTHSFRIGGASAAAAAGILYFVIQTLGRWKSDSFKRYVRLSHHYIGQAYKSLVKQCQ